MRRVRLQRASAAMRRPATLYAWMMCWAGERRAAHRERVQRRAGQKRARAAQLRQRRAQLAGGRDERARGELRRQRQLHARQRGQRGCQERVPHAQEAALRACRGAAARVAAAGERCGSVNRRAGLLEACRQAQRCRWCAGLLLMLGRTASAATLSSRVVRRVGHVEQGGAATGTLLTRFEHALSRGPHAGRLAPLRPPVPRRCLCVSAALARRAHPPPAQLGLPHAPALCSGLTD